MAIDIAKSLFARWPRKASSSHRLFDTLPSAYVRKAEDALRHYTADAWINGLELDRNQEELAVTTSCAAFARRPAFWKTRWAPLIPNWNRVQSALPDYLEEPNEAVR
jgi:glucosyl-3-phosphoglycerate synthase